jgi:Mlc titration factor MtfA (ptsG expression regulator)
MGYKAPKSFFQNVEFEREFDEFLHQTVGYDTLRNAIQGLFISPYAATSLREYFATAFTDFYIDPNHKYLKTVSPAVYEKIILLQNEENLDF